MRCIRCQKPLNRPALSILTKRGYAHYGPKCARLAGLTQPKTRTKAAGLFTRHIPAEADPRQMALELAA
jgi:hypothetical protein